MIRKNIYARLAKENLDGLLISSPFNITYLTDYISRDSLLLLIRNPLGKNSGAGAYFTDSRYAEEAKAKLGKKFRIKEINGAVFKIIADTCAELKIKRLGFEEQYFTFAQYRKIRGCLKGRAALISTRNIVEYPRQIKTPQELKKIKKAVSITIKALNYIKPRLIPGKTELEIAAELERFIRINGASAASFEMIVASGPNSSFPHHITSGRRIKNNEPVLIDMGVNVSGYKSDLTRVFFLGKITPLWRRIYEIVRAAQADAINQIKPEVKISRIDLAARQYIAENGYGSFFGHSLGHGVGLEIHESPRICAKETNVLKPGMVFTVEPAIYLPHKFGIRIEDMVLVTEKGAEIISGALNK